MNPDALDIQGPKGKLTQRIPPGIGFEVIDGQLKAAPMRQDPELGKFHGLARSLAANGILGVTEGFKRELDIVGVGYRAELRGKQVVFALGYSHSSCSTCAGIDIAIEKQTHSPSRASIASWWTGRRQHPPPAQPDPSSRGRAYTASAQEEGGKTGLNNHAY